MFKQRFVEQQVELGRGLRLGLEGPALQLGLALNKTYNWNYLGLNLETICKLFSLDSTSLD